ncbi:EamA family transporter [Candidatus Woesearchaeota archaeon]|nr:EamA family transporter [Candidatus Woesearchaeota archaeon]
MGSLKGSFLIVLVTFLTSTAQIFFKKGASLLPLIFINWWLLFGGLIYFFALLIFVRGLREGEASKLVPLLSASYIIVAVTSSFYLGESISFFKIIGIVTIIFGATLLIGSGKSAESLEVPV